MTTYADQTTINNVEPRTQAIAIANQTIFNTNWTANADTDILVYHRTSSQQPDDQTQIVSSSDYAVEFVGTYQTVRITLTTPCAADDIVTISRDTPSDRDNLYTNTNFTASMLNQDFGILTLVDQQDAMFSQSLGPHYNTSCTYTDTADTAIDLILPILTADQFWAKNANNDAIVATNISTFTMPIGTVIDYAGASVPAGFLACNGNAVSRTTYLDLFAIVGTTFGAGDTVTTFGLPNISQINPSILKCIKYL